MSDHTPTEDNKPKGVLILTHMRSEGSCMLGRVVHERGLRIKTIVTPREDDLDFIDPLRPDLLIVMGGPVGVYQGDDYPFLKQEAEILRERIKHDLPTIGVCLGGQLIATALGSTVYKGERSEVGWHPLNLTEAAKGTIFENLCGNQTNMFHWHSDTFELPGGATLMASTDQYQNQIFTYGKNILSLQCHPEIRQNLVRELLVMFVNHVTGPHKIADLDELRADTDQYVSTLNVQAEKFFNAWLHERDL